MINSCESYATALLNRIGQKALPTRPREVARKLNIPIKEVDADNRYDGYLLKYKDSCGIMINKSIKYETRKNFTIAHEIGHAEIPHHKDSKYICLKSYIDSPFRLKRQEREANEFAAELLMPAAFVSEEIKNKEIGLEVIKSISEKCETSLTSSGFRYLKYCPEIAAFLVSEDNKIKQRIVSFKMKEKKLAFNKGDVLDKQTIAFNFFNKDGTISSGKEDKDQVDVSAWFPTLDYSQYNCFECSIPSPNFNQVISLIWLIEKYNNKAKKPNLLRKAELLNKT